MRDPKKIFASAASFASYEESKKYGESYRLVERDEVFFSEKGLPYGGKSGSALLNAFFFRADTILNTNKTIPDYNPRQSYEKGAVVILNGDPVIIACDIDPGGIAGNYDSLNKITAGYINVPPASPFWSTESLSLHFFNGNGKVKVVGDSSVTVDTQYIRDQLQYTVKDYLADPDVNAHKNDDFRIHVYGSGFLLNADDSPDAFDFNFPKKLIFTANDPLILSKNIFKCFPANSIVFIKNQRYASSNMNRDFDRKTNMFYTAGSLEIMQVGKGVYRTEGLNLLARPPIYIDVSTPQDKEPAKVYALTPASGILSNNPILPADNGNITVISLADSDSMQAVNLLREKNRTFFPYIMRLELDRYTFFFVPNGDSSCACISFDTYLHGMKIVSSAINIDKKIVMNLSVGDSLRILKNYGQFGDEDRHLAIRENTINSSVTACFLIRDASGNFSFGPILEKSDPAFGYIGKVQYFDYDSQKLYVIDFKTSLREELYVSKEYARSADSYFGIESTAKIYDVKSKTKKELKSYGRIPVYGTAKLKNPLLQDVPVFPKNSSYIVSPFLRKIDIRKYSLSRLRGGNTYGRTVLFKILCSGSNSFFSFETGLYDESSAYTDRIFMMSGDYGVCTNDRLKNFVFKSVTSGLEFVRIFPVRPEDLKNKIRFVSSDSYFTETFHIDASSGNLIFGNDYVPVNETVNLQRSDGSIVAPLSKYILKGL